MGSFRPATHFAVGTEPFSVATGDFNGDGLPDLATANFGSDDVSVLAGVGAGGFAAATEAEPTRDGPAVVTANVSPRMAGRPA